MPRDSTVPDHVVEELSGRGIAIIAVLKTGGGHWAVKFRSADGQGICKWTWPSRHTTDWRAMRNNKSGLKQYLRRIGYG